MKAAGLFECFDHPCRVGARFGSHLNHNGSLLTVIDKPNGQRDARSPIAYIRISEYTFCALDGEAPEGGTFARTLQRSLSLGALIPLHFVSLKL